MFNNSLHSDAVNRTRERRHSARERYRNDKEQQKDIPAIITDYSNDGIGRKRSNGLDRPNRPYNSTL